MGDQSRTRELRELRRLAEADRAVLEELDGERDVHAVAQQVVVQRNRDEQRAAVLGDDGQTSPLGIADELPDRIESAFAPLGEVRLVPAQPFDKGAFLERLRRLRKSLPVQSESAGQLIRRMRDEDRY